MAAELERVFASCDDTRATGPRDRAVLLLLGRLGLRASEVAALQRKTSTGARVGSGFWPASLVATGASHCAGTWATPWWPRCANRVQNRNVGPSS